MRANPVLVYRTNQGILRTSLGIFRTNPFIVWTNTFIFRINQVHPHLHRTYPVIFRVKVHSKGMDSFKGCVKLPKSCEKMLLPDV